jgi:hypothetical protein
MRIFERPIHRRDAENAEYFSIGGRYRHWKTTHRFANPNPPQAAGSFIKSVSPDFMKNKNPLRPLPVFGEKIFKELKSGGYEKIIARIGTAPFFIGTIKAFYGKERYESKTLSKNYLDKIRQWHITISPSSRASSS